MSELCTTESLFEQAKYEISESPMPVNSPSPCFEDGAIQFLLERRYPEDSHKPAKHIPFLMWVAPVLRTNYRIGMCDHQVFKVTRQSLEEWAAISGKSIHDYIANGTGWPHVCACIGRAIE